MKQEVRAVKQKKKNFMLNRKKIIKDEVNKLLDGKFVNKVLHLEWLPNVVLVKKAHMKWHVCIDFMDLNKVCLKDSFSLPYIDQLVDVTTGYKLLSFIDAYFGYYQIFIVNEDRKKISFITDQGIYCYDVISLGLKNVGAIFQRMINKIFVEQIGKNVEAYKDDIVVKSEKVDEYIKDLEEVFSVLRKFRVKLNLKKYVFKVVVGKFLGFMVS